MGVGTGVGKTDFLTRQIAYALTLDMAKELAMVERTPKGK